MDTCINGLEFKADLCLAKLRKWKIALFLCDLPKSIQEIDNLTGLIIYVARSNVPSLESKASSNIPTPTGS